MTARKKSTKPKEEILLSKEEVFDVLKFAASIYQGIYTPDLVNSRFKDITMSPQQATADGITSALTNPKTSEQQLIGYSEYLELTSLMYKRLLLYFSGMPSFDINYVCTNIKNDKDYTSKKYTEDLKIVSDFFDKFNYKEAFKIALKEMLRAETYYGIFRDDGNKYVIQELPQQYCKTVGRWDYGLLYDFNMYMFLVPGISIDMYPKIFKRMFSKVFGENGTADYNPSANIDMRTGNFVYWTQTSPKDGFIAFKFFPEIGTNVPFLAPYMPEAVLQPAIRALQTDSYIAESSKIISGQVPFLRNEKASVKDSLALDPTTLGRFLALVKSGLPSAIKVIAAPLDQIGPIEFSGNNDIYDSYLSTAASSSGINSRLIYSKDRQNLLETKLSMDVDINVLRPVYSQFEGALEYWVNQRTKTYKFKFLLEGFENSLDRDMRFERVSKLSEQGIVLEQKYASALGLSPFDLRRMMAETKANGFVNGLTPIVKSSQMGADKAGRPSVSDNQLGDSGAESREAGSNEEKGEE